MENKLVSISDKLPKDGARVLVLTKHDGYKILDYWGEGLWRGYYDPVTHWQHLPERPV